MDEQSWHSLSREEKAEWGVGPWVDEPDKVQWVDPATDLDCLVVRGPMGGLCGYVGLPPGHPMHGRPYQELADDLDVHGGLTFSAACRETGDPATGICHVPLPGRPAEVWWLGFDCGHAWDLLPQMEARMRELEEKDPEFRRLRQGATDVGRDTYRDLAYVRSEVAGLARQVALGPGGAVRGA